MSRDDDDRDDDRDSRRRRRDRDRDRDEDDDDDYSPARRRSSRDSLNQDLTAVDWLLCIFCSGIGCIVGIIRMIQGDSRGGKMVGLSLLFAVIGNVIRFAIIAANNNK